MAKRSTSLAALYQALNAEFLAGALAARPGPDELRARPLRADPAERGVIVRRYQGGTFRRRYRLRAVDGIGAFGVFHPPGQYWPARIVVDAVLPDWGERRVLLHEMVHCFPYFSGVKETPPHGAPFIAELDR